SCAFVDFGLQYREVRLRLRVVAKYHRVLYRYDAAVTDGAHQKSGKPIDGRGMSCTDGSHFEHLPIDQFDPRIRRQNAHLPHSIELVDGEPGPGGSENGSHRSILAISKR